MKKSGFPLFRRSQLEEFLNIHHEDCGAADLDFDREGRVPADVVAGRGRNDLRAPLGLIADDLDAFVDLVIIRADDDGRVAGLQKAAGRRQPRDRLIRFGQCRRDAGRVIV
jgi:hypothetical protein